MMHAPRPQMRRCISHSRSAGFVFMILSRFVIIRSLLPGDDGAETDDSRRPAHHPDKKYQCSHLYASFFVLARSMTVSSKSMPYFSEMYCCT